MGGGELLVEEQGVEEAEAVRLGHHLHRAATNPLLILPLRSPFLSTSTFPFLFLFMSVFSLSVEMGDSPRAPPLNRSRLRNNQLPKFNSFSSLLANLIGATFNHSFFLVGSFLTLDVSTALVCCVIDFGFSSRRQRFFLASRRKRIIS